MPRPHSQLNSKLDSPDPERHDEDSVTLTAADEEQAIAAAVLADDLEAQRIVPKPALDIEHLQVTDDPRLWSRTRKTLVLATISFCAAGGTVSASIFFPATNELQADLRTTDQLIAASVSLFIAGQGIFPVFWSAISEIKGRRVCYIVAIVIYIVATTVCSRAQQMGVFVAMRVLQALGSGAVLVLGAGTLADIYDVHERGTRLGIFYSVPLVGPAMGPLIGGGLNQAFNWRATFYFLIIYGCLCFGLMIWLPETFRKERSLAWRKAMQRARAHARADLLKAQRKLPGAALEKQTKESVAPSSRPQTSFAPAIQEPNRDAPTAGQLSFSALSRVKSAMSLRSGGGDDNVKIHLRDVNPLAATGAVLSRLPNFIAIAFSGLLFASQYCVTFTASRTFADPPYNLNSLDVGLVLLSFGSGNVLGSILGGRYSDHVFNTIKAKNGGKGEPEMRIKSTLLALPWIPALFVAYAWTVSQQVALAGPIVILFFLGLSTLWVYSTLLAFVVDANPGQSSSAVACNSLFRGVLACAASQAAEPLIGVIGHGAFYSAFAGLLLAGEVGLVIVGIKGKQWREERQAKEDARHEQRVADGKVID